LGGREKTYLVSHSDDCFRLATNIASIEDCRCQDISIVVVGKSDVPIHRKDSSENEEVAKDFLRISVLGGWVPW